MKLSSFKRRLPIRLAKMSSLLPFFKRFFSSFEILGIFAGFYFFDDFFFFFDLIGSIEDSIEFSMIDVSNFGIGEISLSIGYGVA